jgi:hypothetical protein
MSADWYCAHEGRSSGPFTAAEIRDRARLAPGGALFVWKAGMAEWADARQAPELWSGAPKKTLLFDRAELARRARHELYEYLGIAAYLWVCFGALIIYKAAILRSVGVDYAPMGVALVKALISAKFIMVLQALKLDLYLQRSETPFAIILQKAGLFTLFLMMLTLIEEIIVGRLHGELTPDILSEFAGGTLPQALSVGLLMFLIMIPFFALRESGFSLWKAARD